MRKFNTQAAGLFLSLLLLSLSACAPAKGYRGAKLPADSLASITCFGCTIHQVNDVEVGATASEVLVPAGANRVYLTVNASNYNSASVDLDLKELRVDLKAQEDYIISGPRGGAGLCAWVKDSSTGNPDYAKSAGCL